MSIPLSIHGCGVSFSSNVVAVELCSVMWQMVFQEVTKKMPLLKGETKPSAAEYHACASQCEFSFLRLVVVEWE